jgi:hypothetical protein
MSLLGLATVVLMGQAPPRVAKEVRAERFVLVDEHARMRGELTISANGGPALLLYHGYEKTPGPDTPRQAIDLRVNDDQPRVGESGRGEAIVGLRDGRGQMLAELAVSTAGRAALKLRDDALHTRAILGHTELAVKRTASIEQREESSLVLLEKGGRVLWSAP